MSTKQATTEELVNVYRKVGGRLPKRIADKIVTQKVAADATTLAVREAIPLVKDKGLNWEYILDMALEKESK